MVWWIHFITILKIAQCPCSRRCTGRRRVKELEKKAQLTERKRGEKFGKSFRKQNYYVFHLKIQIYRQKYMVKLQSSMAFLWYIKAGTQKSSLSSLLVKRWWQWWDDDPLELMMTMMTPPPFEAVSGMTLRLIKGHRSPSLIGNGRTLNCTQLICRAMQH